MGPAGGAATLGRGDLVACGPALSHIAPLDRLAPARSAGFAGVSLSYGDLAQLEKDGISAREYGDRIRDAGLLPAEMDCIIGWLPGHACVDRAGAFASLLDVLTAEHVVAAATAAGCRSVSVAEICGLVPSIDEAAASFATICDLAADHGLLAHLEFLPIGGIPDLETAWRIVEGAGRANGGIMLDAWHLFRSGSTLSQLARIPGDRIMALQIDDALQTASADLALETQTARLLPGDGAFDLKGLMRTLDAIGCAAPIGVEVFSTQLADLPADELLQLWAASARDVIDQSREVSAHG